jgi:hypothetical protein
MIDKDNKPSFWERSKDSFSTLIDSYYYRGLLQGVTLGSLTTLLVVRYIK